MGDEKWKERRDQTPGAGTDFTKELKIGKTEFTAEIKFEEVEFINEERIDTNIPPQVKVHGTELIAEVKTFQVNIVNEVQIKRAELTAEVIEKLDKTKIPHTRINNEGKTEAIEHVTKAIESQEEKAIAPQEIKKEQDKNECSHETIDATQEVTSSIEKEIKA